MTVGCIATILVFLPHLSVLRLTATDVQIDGMLVAYLWLLVTPLLFFGRKYLYETIVPQHLFFFFCLAYSLAISVVQNSFDMRSYISLMNLTIFSLFGSMLCNIRKPLIYTILGISLFLLFIGLMQQFYDRQFMTWLIRHARTSPSRGVTGLASEPFFYGIQALSLLFLLRMLASHKLSTPRWIFPTCQMVLLFQILVLARSVAALILVALYFLCEIIFSRNIKTKIAGVAIIAVMIAAFVGSAQLFPLSRMAHIYRVVSNNGIRSLSLDESMHSRSLDLFNSLGSFAEQLPFSEGYGPGRWMEVQQLRSTSLNFPDKQRSVTYRPLSGLGSVIFELGWVGFLLCGILFLSFWSRRFPYLKGVGISLVALMFSTVSLASPFFGALLGLAIAIRKDPDIESH